MGYRPTSDGPRPDISPSPKEQALSEKEKLIADIMGAQIRLQHVFADDRSDPLFETHLTMSQLKILLLLARHGTVSGGELARMLGVGAAALSGMVDRLVAQDLVARTEPGPFAPRTVEFGGYVGVRLDGALVAMAGALIPDRPAKHRELGLQRIQDPPLRDRRGEIEAYLPAGPREVLQMRG